LKVSEIRKIFGHNRDEGENYTVRSFVICTLLQIIFRVMKRSGMKWPWKGTGVREIRN
jgi:hypothetical protein